MLPPVLSFVLNVGQLRIGGVIFGMFRRVPLAVLTPQCFVYVLIRE